MSIYFTRFATILTGAAHALRQYPLQRAPHHRVTAATYIAFDELLDDNWSIVGKLLDEE
jgi:hypothetical protein